MSRLPPTQVRGGPPWPPRDGEQGHGPFTQQGSFRFLAAAGFSSSSKKAAALPHTRHKLVPHASISFRDSSPNVGPASPSDPTRTIPQLPPNWQTTGRFGRGAGSLVLKPAALPKKRHQLCLQLSRLVTAPKLMEDHLARRPKLMCSDQELGRLLVDSGLMNPCLLIWGCPWF